VTSSSDAGRVALLALTFLIVNAVDDDGAPGPSGDSLSQVGGDAVPAAASET